MPGLQERDLLGRVFYHRPDFTTTAAWPGTGVRPTVL